MGIYDYTVPNTKGGNVSLSDYKGKVLLIVNTATGCGFTPQYKDLEALHEEFHDRGLEIIDIPCNQFAGQAPGTDEEIHTFCTLNYNTQFPQMKKSEVNGDGQLPLYKFLKSEKGFKGLGDSEMAKGLGGLLAEQDPAWDKNDDIKWNFTKFLVDRDGNVVERFEPTYGMEVVREAVSKLI